MDAVLNLEDLAFKKDLKLSVLDPDSTQQGGVLTLNPSETVSARYQVFVQPCCTVTCGCCEVLFRCRAISTEDKPAAPDKSQEFWLDVKTQKSY